MVLLTLLSSITKAVAPFGLKHGLSLRYRISGGAIRDNPTLDALLLLPLFQKLISQEMQVQVSAKQSQIDVLVDRTFDRIFGPDKNEGETNPQVRLLERYLRPVLVPNEQWADVKRWMSHTRFVKFARSEYLLARYGSDIRTMFEKYPKLRQGPQFTRGASFLSNMLSGRGDPEKGEFHSVNLPSSRTIATALNMSSWKRTKDTKAIWDRLTKLTIHLDGYVVAGTNVRYPVLDDDTDLSHLSIEDILELAGGHVASCGPFNALCDECNIFQFWSKEYIEGLADYLQMRSKSNTIILDIGAGDGLLAQLLREQLQRTQKRQNQKSPKIVAIDDGSWRIRGKAEVEHMTAANAIEKYAASHHVIILCSWMPMGVDWAALFRGGGVEEYILIGEAHDGNCGDNWKTWGNPSFQEAEDLGIVPPFEADGYEANVLSNLLPYSFSIFDSADSANSTTVSFRKTTRSK